MADPGGGWVAVIEAPGADPAAALPTGEHLRGRWHLWTWDLMVSFYSAGEASVHRFGNQLFVETEGDLMDSLRGSFEEGIRVEGLELLRAAAPRKLGEGP